MNKPISPFDMSALNLRIAIPVAVGVLVFAAGLWWLLHTNYVNLDAQLAPQVRQEAISALQSAGIDYRATPEGQLQIPDDQVQAAHNALTSLGLAFPEPQGFEILDKADYTLSDFSQRLNYQRALEGELARTIMGLSEVRSARVHLTMPKQELFGARKNVGKASVTLQLKQGRDLSAESANGIREIVASSVDGLSPDKVSIIDDQGRPFGGGNLHAGLDQRSRVARQLEVELERRVRQLLQESYGAESPYVSVRADLNFDKVTSVRESAVPTGDAVGFLTREQTSDSTPLRDNDGAVGTSAFTREYAYGKEHTETEFATGKLARLSIAVALPAKFAGQDLAALEKVIAAAIGLQAERGDKLVVSVVPALQTSPAMTAATLAATGAGSDGTTAAGSNTGAEAGNADTGLPNIGGIPFALLLGMAALAALIVLALFLAGRPGKPATPKLSAPQRDQLLADLQKWLQE